MAGGSEQGVGLPAPSAIRDAVVILGLQTSDPTGWVAWQGGP